MALVICARAPSWKKTPSSAIRHKHMTKFDPIPRIWLDMGRNWCLWLQHGVGWGHSLGNRKWGYSIITPIQADCRYRPTIGSTRRFSNAACVIVLHNITTGKKATLMTDIVATIVVLNKAGHQTKKMAKLTGVCERLVRNRFWQFQDKFQLRGPTLPQREIGFPSLICRAEMRGLASNCLFATLLALGFVLWGLAGILFGD